MAYMIVVGVCCTCEATFGFNAQLVPSIMLNGVREPVCQACVDRANPGRISKGLQEIKVLPGAYAESAAL